ncbi:MAG: Nif11-like leader peptide family natural product precursor, partial [Pseudodesulfovibrio sp.]|nr:Nif11-like leader peptide family natural product precursor [Pseudodesulfovibrio sp.]
MPPSNNAHALYTQIMDDPEFRSKLADNSSPEAIAAEIQSYGKAHGLPVSIEDIRQAMTL